MGEPEFQLYECVNPTCGLRFPTDLSVSHFELCPSCSSPMRKMGDPYINYRRPACGNLIPGTSLSIILDNLRSAQNVGSIFRTANGAGVQHIYCCGTTPTPDHAKVKKSSLGAEEVTGWSYHPNCLKLIEELKLTGCLLLALESTPESISLINLAPSYWKHPQLALLVGNEISGIDPQVLGTAHQVLHIPMAGTKTSLNVAVTTGIALYLIINNLVSPPPQ